MFSIDLTASDNNKLISYHEKMFECVTRGVQTPSSLANELWSAVLKELSRRNLIKLVSGSFDDIGNMRVIHMYKKESDDR